MATDDTSSCNNNKDEELNKIDVRQDDNRSKIASDNSPNTTGNNIIPNNIEESFYDNDDGERRPMISSTSCRQLVAGSYDVIINESSSLRSILLDYLERFNQHELALGQPDCCYTNEFKLLKEFSKSLKEDKANVYDGELDYNQRKNRYKDIIPFNHTRVILNNDEHNPTDPSSSYINANYIRGPSGSQRAYIACQGPLQSTLNDFWRMIWECNVSVIIMACNEYESGKPKCELYWPLQTDTSQTYGRIQVTLLRERSICSDFLIRKFSVKLLEPISHSQPSEQQQRFPANNGTSTRLIGTSSNVDDISRSSASSGSSNDSCSNGGSSIGKINHNANNINMYASDHYGNRSNNQYGDQQMLINHHYATRDCNDINNPANLNGYHNLEPSEHLQQQQPIQRQQSYRIVSERTICQFHYTTWPDHGVPNSVHPILELVRLVREVQPADDRPILVHCSAGCGRTGTICCIDYVWGLLRRSKIDSSFDLCGIISDMRQQRMAMVQTLEQYILCHRTVAALFMQQLDFMEDSNLNDNLESIDDEDDKVFDEQDIGPVII